MLIQTTTDFPGSEVHPITTDCVVHAVWKGRVHTVVVHADIFCPRSESVPEHALRSLRRGKHDNPTQLEHDYH
jgi:hypothetical protein